MRRSVLAVLTVALLGPAAPALAHPVVELEPTLPTDVTFSATDNVEYFGRFPEHSGTAGGFPSEDGNSFYLTDPRGVYVYDTTTPESPELLGSLPLFQSQLGVALAQEDPDTNGEILLVDASPTPNAFSRLQVVDVSDPENMSVLSSVPVTDHTWSCVSGVDAEGEQNSCAFAYGRTGHIVDLRDPTNAVLLPETWRKAVGHGDRSNSGDLYTHDLTEIRPGLVMSAGRTNILMDTSDPTAPVRLADIEQEGRFSSLGYHSVEWANGGTDPYIVLGTEIGPPTAGGPESTGNLPGNDCAGENSVIETWDASQIVKKMKAYEKSRNPKLFKDAEFTKVDEFDATGRGIFLDGKAAASERYCAHWMELAPDFDGEGRMAVSYYNRGTRFVDVAADGTMSEFGWITPADSYSGSAQWISDDVVYIMDYRRGLEIVKLSDQEATGVHANAPDVIALASTFELTPGPGSDSPWGAPTYLGAGLLLALGLWHVERVARRREAGTAA